MTQLATAAGQKHAVNPALVPLLTPISDLRPDPRNARTHDDRSMSAIAASLRRFGQQKPIVVDAGGIVRAGNGLFLSAKSLGWTHIAAVRTDLAAAELTAYALADNQTATLAGWDHDTLAAMIAELQAEDATLLDAVGFGDDLSSILDPPVPPANADDIPEPPDAATTKPGDLWLLGDHRLLCGDSAQAEDLDRLLGGARIHLVNTDPPYNVKVEPRSNNAIAAGLSSFSLTNHQYADMARDGARARPTTEKLRPKDRPLVNDFVSDAEFDRLLRAWFGQIARVLDPGRAFYIWGGYANCGNYPPVLKASGLYFSQAIIWIKEHPVLTRKDFMGNHEWCFYGWREGAGHTFLGTDNIRDVWEVGMADSAGEYVTALADGMVVADGEGSAFAITPRITQALRARTIYVCDASPGIYFHLDGPCDVWRVKKVPSQKMVHLTEKPVELAIRAMHYSSRRGENVLDLFGGSGSTLVAAEIAGRKAFLMELDTLYCDVIVQRYEQFTGKKAQLEKGSQ
jgi:DNA modification methylase